MSENAKVYAKASAFVARHCQSDVTTLDQEIDLFINGIESA